MLCYIFLIIPFYFFRGTIVDDESVTTSPYLCNHEAFPTPGDALLASPPFGSKATRVSTAENIRTVSRQHLSSNKLQYKTVGFASGQKCDATKSADNDGTAVDLDCLVVTDASMSILVRLTMERAFSRSRNGPVRVELAQVGNAQYFGAVIRRGVRTPVEDSEGGSRQAHAGANRRDSGAGLAPRFPTDEVGAHSEGDDEEYADPAVRSRNIPRTENDLDRALVFLSRADFSYPLSDIAQDVPFQGQTLCELDKRAFENGDLYMLPSRVGQTT